MEWSEAREYHWDTAAHVAAAAVEWVAKPDGDARVLNINVPEPRRSPDLRGVREAELAPPVRCGWRRPTCREGDLKIEIKGRADPAPGTDVAIIQEGYVSVTPLMSIVRGPATGAPTPSPTPWLTPLG